LVGLFICLLLWWSFAHLSRVNGFLSGFSRVTQFVMSVVAIMIVRKGKERREKQMEQVKDTERKKV
jgi:hypothetical protein